MSRQLGRVLLTWAHLGPAAGRPLAERARRLAARAPAPLAACADAAWGLCAYLSGDPRGPPAACWPRPARSPRCTDEALVLADRAVEVAELLPVASPLAIAARGLALLDLGRFPDAASVAGQLAGPASDHPWYLVCGYGQRLSATPALRQGRVEQAHAGFGRLRRQVEGWGVADPAHIPWAADGIAAALVCGHDHDAGRIVERRERAAPLSSRWPKAAAATGRAALAERASDLDAAEASHRQALTILDGSPLRLARAGRTNRQIAHQLRLSVNTVETHLSNVYRKLGIHRRWELIARDDLAPDT